MTTITDQLADALRSLLREAGRKTDELAPLMSKMDQAREALAAYDAQRAQLAAAGANCAEPWHANGDYTMDARGTVVCQTPRKTPTYWQEQDAPRRIVACVNACAGWSTEKLESGRYGITQTVWGE